MNGPVLIPICSWFLTALSDFFNSLLGLSRQRHSPLHDLRILQGAGRLHQMQDPHAEAVNVGVNFREAADRVADSPAFVKIRRPQALRAWKREVAGLHDRPRLSVEFEASGEICQRQPPEWIAAAWRALLQGGAQREGLSGCKAYALSIHRIEARKALTRRQNAVRKALHAIVATPNSGWDIVGAQLANKLGLRQPVMDGRMGETTCPFQEPFQIAGSKFAAT